jgi:hypothetical protein
MEAKEETLAEKAEREYPNWRGIYRLDYERDEETGRIKELRLITASGELFGDDTLVVSVTPDGFIYIGEPEFPDE